MEGGGHSGAQQGMGGQEGRRVLLCCPGMRKKVRGWSGYLGEGNGEGRDEGRRSENGAGFWGSGGENRKGGRQRRGGSASGRPTILDIKEAGTRGKGREWEEEGKRHGEGRGTVCV